MDKNNHNNSNNNNNIENDDYSILQLSLNHIYDTEKLNIRLFTLQTHAQSLFNDNMDKFDEILHENLLVNSTIVLKNKLIKYQDEQLLVELSNAWNSFHSKIITWICAIFVNTKTKMDVRTMCLTCFRDFVVLDGYISDTVARFKDKFYDYPTLNQLFLLLVTYCEKSPPTENYMKLEKYVDQLNVYKKFYYNSKICFSQMNLEHMEAKSKLTKPK